VDFDPFAFSLDDPLVLQKREVLRDSCLGKPQTFPDMLDVAFLRAEPGHNLQADRMTENLQNFGIVIEITGFVKFLRHHIKPHHSVIKTIYIVEYSFCQQEAESLNNFMLK
jgi:hypothetical protein